MIYFQNFFQYIKFQGFEKIMQLVENEIVWKGQELKMLGFHRGKD